MWVNNYSTAALLFTLLSLSLQQSNFFLNSRDSLSAMGEFSTRSYFHAADYAVFGVMLVASLAIGLYYGLSGGRQRTSAEYVLADRKMTLVPITLSLLASYFSGLSLQGIPSDVYHHGPMIIWLEVPILIGGILSLLFFMPMYYRLGITSVYEASIFCFDVHTCWF